MRWTRRFAIGAVGLCLCAAWLTPAASAASHAGWDVTIVDAAGDMGLFASLAVNSNGDPAISYFHNSLTAPNRALMYAYRDATGVWQTEVVATGVGVADMHTSLAFLPGDVAAISFFDLSANQLKYVERTAGIWGAPVTLDTGAPGAEWMGAHNSLAVLPSGEPAIAYFDAQHGYLKYIERVSGTWIASVIIDDDLVHGFASLAILNDQPAISYTGKQRALKFAWWDGAWHTATVDSGSNFEDTSLAAIPGDYAGDPAQPGIAYYDVAMKNLKYARHTGSDFALQWKTRLLDAGAQVGEYPSLIAVDTFKEPNDPAPVYSSMISYFDYDEGLKLTWSANPAAIPSVWQRIVIDETPSPGDLGLFTGLGLVRAGDDFQMVPGICYYDSGAAVLKFAQLNPAFDCDGNGVPDEFEDTGAQPSIEAMPGETPCDPVILATTEQYIEYLWSPGGETTEAIEVSASGTYSLTVTDALGCMGATTIEITIEAPPIVEIAAIPGPTPCDPVTLDAGTGTGWTYLWSVDEQTTQMIEVDASGSYSVTVTDINGCITTATIDVTLPLNPMCEIETPEAVCAMSEGNLASVPDAGEGATYAWEIVDGTITDGAGTPTITYTVGDTEGIWLTVEITDALGCTCSGEAGVWIEHPLDPPAEVWSNRDYFCANDPDTIKLYADGRSGFPIEWFTDGCGETLIGAANPLEIPSPEVTTEYFVRWVNSCGATECSSVIVTVMPLPEPPTAATSDRNNICVSDDGDVVLTAEGGSGEDVLWFIGGCGMGEPPRSDMVGYGNPLTIPPPEETTTYYAAWVNECGLSDCAEVTVTIVPLPIATAENTGPVCDGEDVQLLGGPDGMLIYEWTGPGEFTSNEQNPVLSPTVPGEYCLTVTDEYGCASEPVCTIVTVWELPYFEAQNSGPVCAGADVHLYAWDKGEGYTFAWTGPEGFMSDQPDPIVSPAVAGTYCLIVTDEHGCVSEETCTEVIVWPLPVATASNNGPVCTSQPVTLQGGPDGMSSYAWTGPEGFASDEQSPVFTPEVAGEYCLTVIDDNGCESEAACTEVVVWELPMATASNDSPVCEGENVQLLGSPDGMATYAWTGPEGYTSDEQSPILSPALAGQYCLVVTDEHGCMSEESCTDVVVRERPYIEPNNTGPVCAGEDVQLYAYDKLDGYTYAWTGPDGFTSDEANPVVSPAVPGTYCLIVTDEHGCASEELCTEVVVWDLPVATAGNNGPACIGGQVQLTGGPDGMSTYAWTGPDGYESDEQSPLIQSLIPGLYCLIVTDEHGCQSEEVCTDVQAWPDPGVSASNSGPVCAGEDIQLFGGPDGMSAYAWAGPDGFTSSVQSPIISPAVPGTYSLHVTDQHGCAWNPVSTEVVVWTPPVLDPINDGPVCAGEDVQLSAGVPSSEEYTYAWTGPGGFTSAEPYPVISPAVPGAYCVIVTDEHGCMSDEACTEVVVWDQPVCTITADDRVFTGTSGNEISVPDAGPDAIYTWWVQGDVIIETPDPEHSPVISYTAGAPGFVTIDLQIVDGHGCVCVADAFDVTILLPICEGDMNCDGIVDYGDIDPFVAALACIGGVPSCWPPPGVPDDCPWLNGDCNADGNVTYADIDPFVQRIGAACPLMVTVPAGEFALGDPWSEGTEDERPAHDVYVSSFCIDVYEITNAQYCVYLNSAHAQGLIDVTDGVVYKAADTEPYCNTYAFDACSRIHWDGATFTATAGREDHPLLLVSWYGAVAYCNWRSLQDARSPCYDLDTWECDFNATGYRLPTEAEWEKAGAWDPELLRHFRFAEHTDGCGVDCLDPQRANYWDDGNPYKSGPLPHTTPVGFYDGQLHYKVDFDWPGQQTSFQTQDAASYYGCYDMSGNVSEWCHDWYDPDYYESSAYDNPTGPPSSPDDWRVHRSGYYWSAPFHCRSSDRYGRPPDARTDSRGFRCVLRVP